MFNEKRRNHFSFIFQESFVALKNLVFLLALSLFKKNLEGLLFALGIFILSVLFGVFRYLTIKYYVSDDVIVLEKGFLTKDKIQIPFNKISTIDISSNIIDKALSAITIKMDSGAVKMAQEEIKIKISSKDGYLLRDLIVSKKSAYSNTEEELSENVSLLPDKKDFILERKITFKEIILYSLTKGKILWFISTVLVVFSFVSEFVSNIEESMVNNSLDYIGNNVNMLKEQGIGVIILITAIVSISLLILINIFFMIYESIRLYNYTLKADHRNLYITFGLLKTKEYSIPIKKIQSLRYKQSILQQALKIFSLEVVTIGYGDEQKESAIIFPIANKEFIDKVILSVLPEFKTEANINKPPKKALSRFIFLGNAVFTIAFIVALITNILSLKVLVGLYIFLIITNTILGYRQYKNTSLSVDNNILTATFGTIAKTTYIIKQSSIQSITIKEGPFHKLKSVVDFKIDIYTNKLMDFVLIRNMDKTLEEKIERNLDL